MCFHFLQLLFEVAHLGHASFNGIALLLLQMLACFRELLV